MIFGEYLVFFCLICERWVKEEFINEMVMYGIRFFVCEGRVEDFDFLFNLIRNSEEFELWMVVKEGVISILCWNLELDDGIRFVFIVIDVLLLIWL